MRKTFLFIPLLLGLLLTACGDDANNGTTGGTTIKKASELIQGQEVSTSIELSKETNIPVPQWVADVLKKDPDKTRALRCVFEGRNLYMINTCVTCPSLEQITEVFNDNREVICYIGGPESKITCDKAGFGAPGKRQCDPVELVVN
ncbi:MAG: hypothetical protein AAFV95_24945 [Bacteroidota bacterium]